MLNLTTYDLKQSKEDQIKGAYLERDGEYFHNQRMINILLIKL